MKGLVHVYTGNGKGKTTAALGLALRATGQGMKVIVIQFLKGKPDCGEHIFTARYNAFEIVQFTHGNCFVLPEEQLKEDVERAIDFTHKTIHSGKYQMVILDEVFIAIRRRLLQTEMLVRIVKSKPDSLELVLTGSSAPTEIRELADYVTDMQMEKHPYLEGVAARKGIEY